jgi:hypothetical protein
LKASKQEEYRDTYGRITSRDGLEIVSPTCMVHAPLDPDAVRQTREEKRSMVPTAQGTYNLGDPLWPTFDAETTLDLAQESGI